MKTKVTLLSHTVDPLETIYQVWQASRNNETLDWNESCMADSPELVEEVFEAMLTEKIPVAEMIDFVFVLEGVSISLREQLVRHRIGTKVDGRVGMDMVPDLADSSWWAQSMRILNMGKFASSDAYAVPETVDCHAPLLELEPGRRIAGAIYREAMENAERAYNQLVAAGVPLEDARNVIPLAATHRIVWKVNLAALMHILGKRGCWILQLGIWRPVIEGIVKELRDKVHPAFGKLINPPCMKGDKFTGCLFRENNKARWRGVEDEIPPCGLWFEHHTEDAVEVDGLFEDCVWHYNHSNPSEGVGCSDSCRMNRYKTMLVQYAQLWNRNPITGVSRA